MSDSPSSSASSSSYASPQNFPTTTEQELGEGVEQDDEQQQHGHHDADEDADEQSHEQSDLSQPAAEVAAEEVQQVLGEVSDSEDGGGEASPDSSATSSDEEEEQQQQRMEVEEGKGRESGPDEEMAAEKEKQNEGGESGQDGERGAEMQMEVDERDEDIFAEAEDDQLEEEGRGREEAEPEEEAGPRLMAQQLGEISDLEGEEEEEDTGPVRIDLDIVRCRAELGEEGPYFLKMPNFLNVEPKPFDPETYEDELEEEGEVPRDEEGKTRLKLKMENTIRWRNVVDAEGNEKRESNAKIVRWSDGSISLYLGKEIFEIETQHLMDHNHLYIRQGSALQAQSVFREKLIFRPHSTETLTHRKMTMNMAEKTSKTQKVKVLALVGDNPEAERKELIRTEEEKLRAAARREAQQRRIRERPRMAGLTSGFLEGYESDEGGESLAAIKRRYQHAPYTSADRRSVLGGDVSDESDAEEAEERERKARKAINEAKIYSDDEEEDGEQEGAAGTSADDSDSELQKQRRVYQQQQQKKKILIEEDEDDL